MDLIRVAAVAIGMSACTVGIAPPGGPPPFGAPDAGGGGTSGGGTSSGGSNDDGSGGGGGTGSNGCVNQVTSNIGDGHHNPGQDCMNGCHDHGFTVAGTLFTSGTSTTAITGATITVVDQQGQTVTMVSQANGNFYSTTAVGFPLTVKAVSECPNIQSMPGTVSPETGSTTTVGCNSSSCHQPGQQGYIHLP
jgi:hypothetical protein